MVMISMNSADYPIVYGPVISWRLGISLGINATPAQGKVCNFNCLYCELGESGCENTRREYIPTPTLDGALKDILRYPAVDHITIAGSGEPTLASNLANIIQIIRSHSRAPIAVFTNGGKLGDAAVLDAVRLADKVLIKLDVSTEMGFNRFNRPCEKIRFADVLEDIQTFRAVFSGSFYLQCMLSRENADEMAGIAEIAKKLRPDEIQVCSPTRGGNANVLPIREFQKLVVDIFGKKGNVKTPYQL